MSSTTSTFAQQQQQQGIPNTIADLIVNQSSSSSSSADASYSLLILACQKSFVWHFLNDTNTILTFLGPADDSWNRFIGIPPYSNYLGNTAVWWMLHLQQVVLYHLIPHQVLNSTELFMTSSSSSRYTALGLELPIHADTQTIGDYNGGASLVLTNLRATNGYWHVPDQVLLPTTLQVDVRQVLYDANITTTATTLLAFDTMKRLFQLTNLEDRLSATTSADNRGMTLVMVPDTAWQSLAQKDLTFYSMLFDPDGVTQATSLLLYHMIPLNLYPDAVLGHQPTPELYMNMQNNVTAWFTATTTTTTTATTNQTQTTFFVNGVKVLINPILANNGLLQVVEQVLLPPTLFDLMVITTEVTRSFSFYDFLSWLGDARYGVNLTSYQNVTVLAPLDGAFDDTMMNNNDTTTNVPLTKYFASNSNNNNNVWSRHVQSLLLNHIATPLRSISYFKDNPYTKLQMASGFTITVVADNQNGGGDSTDVIIAGSTNVVLPDLFATNGVIHGIDHILYPPSITESIYDQLLANPAQFSTLVLLLQATNLTSLLQYDEGPLTIFAPTNDAFPGVTYTPAQLSDLLLGHVVVSSNVFTDQLVNGTMLVAANRRQWPAMVTDNGNVLIGNAQITLANVLASNGVIQVIDKVLQPPNGTTLSPTISPTNVSPTIVSPMIVSPTIVSPTIVSPTTVSPTPPAPTNASPTTVSPATVSPAIASPAAVSPVVVSPATVSPATVSPATVSPTVTLPTRSPATSPSGIPVPGSVAPTPTQPFQTSIPQTIAPSHDNSNNNSTTPSVSLQPTSVTTNNTSIPAPNTPLTNAPTSLAPSNGTSTVVPSVLALSRASNQTSAAAVRKLPLTTTRTTTTTPCYFWFIQKAMATMSFSFYLQVSLLGIFLW